MSGGVEDKDIAVRSQSKGTESASLRPLGVYPRTAHYTGVGKKKGPKTVGALNVS